MGILEYGQKILDNPLANSYHLFDNPLVVNFNPPWMLRHGANNPPDMLFQESAKQVCASGGLLHKVHLPTSMMCPDGRRICWKWCHPCIVLLTDGRWLLRCFSATLRRWSWWSKRKWWQLCCGAATVLPSKPATFLLVLSRLMPLQAAYINSSFVFQDEQLW